MDVERSNQLFHIVPKTAKKQVVYSANLQSRPQHSWFYLNKKDPTWVFFVVECPNSTNILYPSEEAYATNYPKYTQNDCWYGSDAALRYAHEEKPNSACDSKYHRYDCYGKAKSYHIPGLSTSHAQIVLV